MGPIGTVGVILVALFCIFIVRQAMRLGPSVVSEERIRSSSLLSEATRDRPGQGWQALGIKTTARGLDLKFDHDDDPQAAATFFAPGRTPDESGSTAASMRTVPLTAEFATHHVHSAGFAFQLRLRGTGAVVGRQVRIKMMVDGKNRAVGGGIENDDDIRAAVGDWIEVERAEIRQLAPSA